MTLRRLSVYGLLRAHGNGRIQSAWKDLGFLLLGRGAYISPRKWGWGPRRG